MILGSGGKLARCNPVDVCRRDEDVSSLPRSGRYGSIGGKFGG